MNFGQQMMAFCLAVAMVFSGTQALGYQEASIQGHARDALFKRLDQKLAELRVQEEQLSLLATSLRKAQRDKDAWQVVLDINFLGLKAGVPGMATGLLAERLISRAWAAPGFASFAKILLLTGLLVVVMSGCIIIGRTIYVRVTDDQMQRMRESVPYVEAGVKSLRDTVIALGRATGGSFAGGVLTLRDVPAIRGFSYSELQANAYTQNVVVSPQLLSY